MNKSKRITVRLTDAQWEKLERLIKKSKQSVTQWVSDRIDLVREKK